MPGRPDIRVEINRGRDDARFPDRPTTCRVWVNGDLRFDGTEHTTTEETP